MNTNAWASDFQYDITSPPVINATKFIPNVENNAEFKEIINWYDHYLFDTIVCKFNPKNMSNAICEKFDLVYSLYKDHNLRYDKLLAITMNSESNITSMMEYSPSDVPSGYPLPLVSYVNVPIGNVSANVNYNKLAVTLIPSSPLDQVRSKIAVNDVECLHSIETFELVFKAEDNSPACVKMNTGRILVERGWAINQTNESINTTFEQPKNIDLKNGTVTATLTMYIHIQNFQRLSPPMLIQLFYPNGTLYSTNKISSNDITSDGNYTYTLSISSTDRNAVFGTHKIDVTHNGNTMETFVNVPR
ncbi:MAG: hypothetical protein ACREBJ_07660 [Nitrosotalea sp.]